MAQDVAQTEEKPAVRHPVDQLLPVPKLAVYGFQHVLAFYAGAVIVPILLGSASMPAIAWPCGCGERPFQEHVTANFAEAERVFSGRVVQRGILNAIFAVDIVWKGDDVREVTVAHADAVENGRVQVSTCDKWFQLGVRYIVFAHRVAERLKAASCGPTIEESAAAPVVALLDSMTPRRSVRRNPPR